MITTVKRYAVTDPALLALEPRDCLARPKDRPSHQERGWDIKIPDTGEPWATCRWCDKNERAAARKFRKKTEARLLEERAEAPSQLPRHLQ